MANNFLNPWVLDTAGAGAVKSGLSLVRVLTFRGYSTAGHRAVLQDSAGRIIAELEGITDLSPVQFFMSDDGTPINGLALTTLDSGQVIVDVA